jgi:hypothetical protein
MLSLYGRLWDEPVSRDLYGSNLWYAGSTKSAQFIILFSQESKVILAKISKHWNS